MDYMMYPGKFENSAKCRIEFGVNAGNAVSSYSGNLVDLESELRGQTRISSLCPSHHWTPNQKMNGKLVHQPACQMQYFPRTPLPEQNRPTSCNYKGKNN
jgi:hypothetical protein